MSKTNSHQIKIFSIMSIVAFTITLLIFVLDPPKTEQERYTIIQMDEEIAKNKYRHFVTRFLMEEREIDLDVNQEVDLRIRRNLDGEKLPLNYKIPVYHSVEADVLQKNDNFYLYPGDYIRLIDYEKRKKDEFGSWSRCKIMPSIYFDFDCISQNGNDEHCEQYSGWLSCDWIEVNIK